MRLSWGDRLEVYTLPLLGHGVPIDSGDVGTPVPFVLEAGISSSRRIAAFWGLMPAAAQVPSPAPTRLALREPALPKIEAAIEPQAHMSRHEHIIRRALKAAGLIREK